jgi:DNA mismatch repair protein MutS
MIEDYLAYTKVYKEKYGDKCIVLMQVGSFFEIYTIYPNTDASLNNDVYVIAELCGIQTSRKNKAVAEISLTNPVMAGFPLASLPKFRDKILASNYTIVLVEQVSEPPNPKREVTDIISPGTNVNIVNKRSNYIMVVYYEVIEGYIIAAISGIDLSTGKTFVYEVSSTKDDPEFANDEVFRYISTYTPAELIIISEVIGEDYKRRILKNLNINSIRVHYKWDKYEHLAFFSNINRQRDILEKVFVVKKGFLSIIEILNLERYNNARFSLCCLLEFAYEHNADIVKGLEEAPEVFEMNKNMCIEFNSAIQLNVLSLYPDDQPLMDILNRCATAFGYRTFKERLLQPMIDSGAINRAYDDVDVLLKNNKYLVVRKHLSAIMDLERLKRKMKTNRMAPQDWVSFNDALVSTMEIRNMVDFGGDGTSGSDGGGSIITIADIDSVMAQYTDIIDLEEAGKYNLTNLNDKSSCINFFKKGVYLDIDALFEKYNKSLDVINAACENISRVGGDNDTTACKVENNNRDGYYLTITKKRYENALKIKRDLMNSFDKKLLSSSSTTYKLTNPAIVKESNAIAEYSQQISTLVLKHYKEFVLGFGNAVANTYDLIVKYLVRVDIAANSAKNAFDYCYKRPIIDTGTAGAAGAASFIEAVNMRHPIIERIQDDFQYVGNNISLNQNGILLYGINASGKSSFMKAVGLNIIMAQAGMFVAASSFVYYPYHSIFTRISGLDNIYKGMSSFTVEMTELRNILRRCNKNSLVIGDEICCGTEFISAVSIVASGIDTLIEKGASFIFASHLHELTKLTSIKANISKSKLFVKHIRITFDENNNIIYDRVIQDGQGSNNYGIDVCRTLDMPRDFMKNAELNRKEVVGINSNIINKKSSRYNSKIIIDMCNICNKNKADETHHIIYQQTADKDGFINNRFHKNAKHNLVAICGECHNKEHSGKIKIECWVSSSKGRKLICDYNYGGASEADVSDTGASEADVSESDTSASEAGTCY